MQNMVLTVPNFQKMTKNGPGMDFQELPILGVKTHHVPFFQELWIRSYTTYRHDINAFQFISSGYTSVQNIREIYEKHIYYMVSLDKLCIPTSITTNIVPGSSGLLAITGNHGNRRWVLCDICFISMKCATLSVLNDANKKTLLSHVFCLHRWK